MKSRKAYFHESYPDAPPYPSAQQARRYYEAGLRRRDSLVLSKAYHTTRGDALREGKSEAEAQYAGKVAEKARS